MNVQLKDIFKNLSSEKHYVPCTFSEIPNGKTDLNITSGQNANWTYANFFIQNENDNVDSFRINEGQYVVKKDNGIWALFDYKNDIKATGIDEIRDFVNSIVAIHKSFTRSVNTLIGEATNTKIDSPLQQIFYGAPGTGKSNTVKQVTDGQPKENVFRTTFHPDSDYSTFVGCYKPSMGKAKVYGPQGVVQVGGTDVEKDEITYKFVPQAFVNAYVRAYHTEDPVFLVIEEINRGNCAQIFGDMFQLLDRNAETGESDYAIKPDTDLQHYLCSVMGDALTDCEEIQSGEEMRLPSNLYIWATMNTSDQSLFPIDSAFKRRWDWKYTPIKRADNEPEKKWTIIVDHGGIKYWCYWWEFLEAINHQIEETTHSEDKQLGYFFAKPKAGENFISTDTFVNKVIFYLWNDVFKDEDSAVFQYDNDKVEDVSINRSGTMYFRHFMENKDEMIHYFINKLFAMGKDNTPVVPIDYLKNDSDSKVIEHLPKMRELEEEAPAPEENSEEKTDDADGKTKRNTDKYVVDGAEEQIYKKLLLEKIVRKQIEKNPSITIEELKDYWKDLSLNSPSILSDDKYTELKRKSPSYEGRYNQIEENGIWVNNQIGGADTASIIIEKAKSLGIPVEIDSK